MPEQDEQNVEVAAADGEQTPPRRVTSRQMTDAELASEDARGRLVALVSIGIVACMSASFFLFWLSRKDAGRPRDLRDELSLIADNTGSFIASRFFLAVAIVLTGALLAHLAMAIASRSASAPRALMFACIAGPAFLALALPLVTLLEVSAAQDFADGSVQTLARAEDLVNGTAFTFSRIVQSVAALVYAIAWVMCGVLSVRVGLLTRMVGYVAVAIGLMTIVPSLAGLFSIITIFWVGAVTIMLLSKGGQKPPAWVLGRPVPWSEVAAKGEEIRSEAEEAEAEAEGAEAEPEFVNPVPEDDR